MCAWGGSAGGVAPAGPGQTRGRGSASPAALPPPWVNTHCQRCLGPASERAKPRRQVAEAVSGAGSADRRGGCVRLVGQASRLRSWTQAADSSNTVPGWLCCIGCRAQRQAVALRLCETYQLAVLGNAPAKHHSLYWGLIDIQWQPCSRQSAAAVGSLQLPCGLQ